MRCVAGIDLGSTTTKAVLLDEQRNVLGRGITNSRSNYDRAAEVARSEAFAAARFELLRREVEREAGAAVLKNLLRAFRLEQHFLQLKRLRERIEEQLEERAPTELKEGAREAVGEIFRRIFREEEARFTAPHPSPRSNFFRDAAGSAYTRHAEELGAEEGVSFDFLLGLYDTCIIRVENEPLELGFRQHIHNALKRIGERPAVRAGVEATVSIRLDEQAAVGTGYGRLRLPFPKEQIRSEILCHGLGAHATFPGTRTVLDIGGQDTKAIQVDARGIVTNFQMNDRCAAGCGRYLGYIADEMNIGLHE